MRPFSIVGLLLCAALFAGAAAAEPPGPFDGEPFSTPPAVLAKLAAAVQGEEGETVLVLLSDAFFSYDPDGRETYTHRLIYKILDKTADESWATVEQTWEPWHQERPQIRARVVTPDGASHLLDRATVTENSTASGSPDMFEDGKVLRGPLPAIEAGSLVEVLITTRDKEPFFEAGTVRYHTLEMGAPIVRARVTLRAPTSLPLRWLQRRIDAPPPVQEVDGGWRTVTFLYKDLFPSAEPEPGLPPDAPRLPYVAFSTGRSWTDLARRYSDIVDRAVAGSSIEPFLKSLGEPAPSQTETIAKVLRKLAAEVRYTGVELGEGSLIPRPPAETLRRKFGDCKDKAVVLTAALRALDIPAYVALLNAGEDEQDIERELPGMGDFNHAIVVVPGNPALWIDPTDPHARAGELPSGDQGRLALIASPTTTDLVRTPESTSAENREIETREFYLADFGQGRAVESDEYWGAPERGLRSAYSSQDAKTIRQGLESYGASAFAADKVKSVDHSDPADLSGPFRLRLEMEGVGLASTDIGEAVVAVQPSVLLRRLPDELLPDEEGEMGKGEDGGRAKRQADYVFAQPMIYELRYRVVPPAGFTPRIERKNQTRRLGPASLSEEYSSAKDGTVSAVLRLDTGKRRYSAKELAELRSSVAEALKEKPTFLHFDQVGESHLEAGRVREALDEFRRLAEAQPKSALPHLRIARALLAGGLGEAAREEARLAVKLEPKLAMAQRDLAWILQHDPVGRRFGPGFDRAGAIAAYRKAIELDPKDGVAHADLAILCEHDAKGRRYFPEADLAEAIAEYQVLRKDLDNHAMDGNLLVALFRSEKLAEVIELAPKIAQTDFSAALAVAATAATKGVDAALREAEKGASEAGTRTTVLASAAQNLISIRRYPEAAELLERASRKSDNAAALMARAEILRKTRKHEAETLPETDPASVVKRLLYAMGDEHRDLATVASYLSAGARQKMAGEGKSLQQWFEKESGDFDSSLRPEGLTQDTALDFLGSAFRFATTGDDDAGFRIAMKSAIDADGTDLDFYVVREETGYRIAALSGAPHLIGVEILRQLERGNLAVARKWLDWAADGLSEPKGDDPIPAVPLLAVWKKGEELDGDALRCAAATLLPTHETTAAEAVSILTACRASRPEAWQRPLDVTLAVAYVTLDQPAELARVAERLALTAPTSSRAFRTQIGALGRLKRWADLRALARQRLEREPGSPEALRALAGADVAEGTAGGLAEGRKRLLEIVGAEKGEAQDFNQLAWMSLFLGPVDDQAFEYGKRASTLTGYKNAATLHTLASLYADLGKTAEAYRLIVQALNVGRMEEPDGDDWYVFGRLAESYGMPAVAKGFYQRTVKGTEDVPMSTRELALRRLAAIDGNASVAAKKAGR